MVSWSTQMRSMRSFATGTAIALFLTSGSALANPDVPGDLWVVNYVKVTGAHQDAVRSGLRNAADTYFYGFDTETHIEANVQEGGSYDLRVIGPGGKVLARQNGLSYDPNGNISRTVSRSAQSWMNNLGCAEGCAVAVSGGAPAPAAAKPVEVAEVVEEAIQRAEAEAPKPEAAVETVEIAKPQAPAAAVAVAEVPQVVQPSVSVPTAPSAPADVQVAAKPVEAKKPEGLDADLVLARPNVAATPRAGTSQATSPTVAKPNVAPKVPEARSIAKPAVAAAPAADPVITAPATPTAQARKPVVAAKPVAPATPEVKIAEPSVEPVETPEVATTAETIQPSVASVVPSAPAVSETPVAAAAAQATSTASEQEVTPGVTLPAPSEGSTPSTVAEIAEQAKPQVTAPTPTAPSVPTVVTTPAPAEVATAVQPSVPTTPEAPTPSAAAQASDDGDGEQLALVNPRQTVTPLPTPTPSSAEAEVLAPKPEQVETAAEAASQPEETDTTTTVETRIAAVDPTAEGPTLANARWVGFTPAVFTGSDNKSGAWISGPFDRKQRTGWITDTATGATTRVTFIWREGGSGSRTALLSREAAKALGLGQGDVANVAVYLPR